MDSVCGEMWVIHGPANHTVTNATGTPSISACYQNTVLTWVPAAYLVVGLPYTVLQATKTRGVVPISSLNVTRQVIAMMLLLLLSARLAHSLVRMLANDDVQWHAILGPLVQALSMLVVMVTTEFERRHGIRSSVFQLVFWTGVFLAGVLTVSSQIVALTWKQQDDSVGFVIVCIYHALSCLLLILSTFIDKCPQGGSEKISQFAVPDPLYFTSSLSKLFVMFPFSFIREGSKETIKLGNCWDLRPQYQSGNNMIALNHYWQQEVERSLRSGTMRHKETPRDVDVPLMAPLHSHSPGVTACTKMRYQPSLLKALLKAQGKYMLLAVWVKVAELLVTFANPIVLRWIILFVQSPDNTNMWEGYLYAVLLLLLSITQAIVGNFLHYTFSSVNIRLRNSIMAAIYNKALKMSMNARKDTTTGEIINLMAVDAFKYNELLFYSFIVWVFPVKIAISVYYLWDILGPSCMAGVAVLVVMSPLKYFFAKFGKKLQMKQMKCKDERIKLTNEVINGVKVLKLYAWEKSFEDKIEELRKKELRVLMTQRIFDAFVHFTFDIGPVLFAVVSFAVYVLSSETNILTPEKAFVSLAYLYILRWPIQALPFVIIGIIHANVAHKRIYEFLLKDELDESSINREGTQKGETVSLTEATFTWDPSSPPLLENISVRVKTGSLVAVVGNVGCGKSSLLLALLGEMHRLAGRVHMKGSIAYVPQLAWIQQATLKNNILFGKPYEDKLYQQVIRDCALIKDLEMLPGGDETGIGEKGINLSGGQKLRVGLARATYQEADVYLLDDPLSAVDSHVGKNIFTNIIGPEGHLKDKTRIIVTHSLWFLSQVDDVIVMDGGKIIEQGCYKTLMAKQGALADLMKSHEDTLTSAKADLSETTSNMDVPRGVDELSSFQNGKTKSLSNTIAFRALRRHQSHEPTPHSAHIKKQPGVFHRQFSLDTPDYEPARSVMSSKSSMTMCSEDNSYGVNSSWLNVAGTMEQIQPLEELHAEAEEITAKLEAEKSVMREEGALIGEEELEEGSVDMSVYWVYLRAVGVLPSLAVILVAAVGVASSVMSSFWLSWWSDAATTPLPNITMETLRYHENHTNLTAFPMNLSRDATEVTGVNDSYYLVVYAVFGVIEIFGSAFKGAISGYAGLTASRVQHQRLLRSVLQSPMTFFDRTPLGRIVNRFSADVSTMSESLPRHITWMVGISLELLGTVTLIAVVTPWSLVAWVVVGVFLGCIQWYFVATQRQMQRIESATKSPVYAHFGESLAGISTIRAYGLQNDFLALCQKKIDEWGKCTYTIVNCHRWLSMTLSFAGSIIVFLSALLVVSFKDEMSPGTVALVITYSLSITGALQSFVRGLGELESQVVCVERVMQYIDHPHEADWVVEDNRPPISWPDKGEIVVKELGMRYRSELDLVLKDISFTLQPGQKIGVVGRTGAGKSSLTLALFRMIEPAHGSIRIDGVDITAIGLHDLRSKLTIIPQDPVLFSGTLRMNLDPFDAFTDEQVWRAIKQAHLADWVKTLAEGLQHMCSESGENLSVGQRQLVCLARALLRHTKVLVLDEATAACDVSTDELIQETIRAEFQGCTVFTIAHRLNTIIDYDRILVLDAGRVREFDQPSVLLENKESIFYSLAKDAGLTS